MPIGSFEIPASQLATFLRVCKTHLYAGKQSEDTNALDSILVYTISGEYGDTPGVGTLLMGVSSDGLCASLMSKPCGGGLDDAILVPGDRIGTITSWLGDAVRESRAEKREDPLVLWSVSNGYESNLRTSPSRTEALRVNTTSTEEYPEREIQTILKARDNGAETMTDTDGNELPVGAMFSFGPASQKAHAVRSILGGRIDYYPPKHPTGVWAVEDKLNGWRGAFPAEKYQVDNDLQNPEIPLYLRHDE